MGKSVSVYLDDEILEAVKNNKLSFSSIVREALKMWLREKQRKAAFSEIKDILTKTSWEEAEKAWKEILADRKAERW